MNYATGLAVGMALNNSSYNYSGSYLGCIGQPAADFCGILFFGLIALAFFIGSILFFIKIFSEYDGKIIYFIFSICCLAGSFLSLGSCIGLMPCICQ